MNMTYNLTTNKKPNRIGIIGLGYIGLPLAVAFSKNINVIGFDINTTRISELKNGFDTTNETSKNKLSNPRLSFTSNSNDLLKADCFIIAVPTPIDNKFAPDLSYLLAASALVGKILKDVVTKNISEVSPLIIYESTVFPGCTEEECIPVIEKESGLRNGKNFKVGYSPERINPGDTKHTLSKIKKIISGQDNETIMRMSALYGTIIKAGLHVTPNIKTAEAAKLIENAQRDVNIAFMNEMALFLQSLNIKTKDVIDAAKTKWNYLDFEPGLVGGHCIPVDPYYLNFKAESTGTRSTLIDATRTINNNMGAYVAHKTLSMLATSESSFTPSSPEILILGAAFKGNVPDLRNSSVLKIASTLEQLDCIVSVFDPLVEKKILNDHGLPGIDNPFLDKKKYNAIIIAVSHNFFKNMPIEAYTAILDTKIGISVLADVKRMLNWEKDKFPDITYWTL